MPPPMTPDLHVRFLAVNLILGAAVALAALSTLMNRPDADETPLP